MTILIALLLAQAAPHPCADDAKRLCPDVQPGQGRIAACLKEHKDQVSQACKARIAEFREGAQACEDDIKRLCPNTKPGPERHQCMQQHKDQVSAACRDFFAQAMERREEMRGAVRACRGDVQQHKSDLSRGCANAMRE